MILDDEMKYRVKTLSEEGLSLRAIEAITGVPKSTVGDFLSKKTYLSWWEELDVLNTNTEGAIIYFIDIETSPIIAYTWGLFNQNIGLNQIAEDWQVLCAGVKRLGEDEVVMLSSRESYTEGNLLALEDCLLQLWAVLDNADIIIAHNGRRFDNKKIRAKLIEFGFPPPSPYKVVDTLDIAKQQFAFTSNKKDYLAKLFGSDGKMETGGMQLWVDCLHGDEEAWDKMHSYCEKDVIELEHIYMTIRGWDTKHPNLQLYYDDDKIRCGTCGSEDVKPVGGYSFTNLSKFPLVKCNHCEAYRRTRENLVPKEKRKNLTMNIGG